MLGEKVRVARSAHGTKSSSNFLRFFETEGIAILTMLIARYKVEIKEEPEFASETFDERRTRILNVKQGLTLA